MTQYAISYGSYYSYLNDKSVHNCEAVVQKFADGEMEIKFPDSIRGKHIFIYGDTTHNAMELFLTIDAARRNSAGEITVVLPYYGYSRQDKKGQGRISLGASMNAHILESLGVDRILTIDLHSDQIQGAFQIPVEHIGGVHLFENKIKKVIERIGVENIVFCSPDAGGTARVERFVKAYDIPMVTMSKHRDKPNSVGTMTLLGDVTGKYVIIVDDMVDTGGTLIKAVNLLLDKGANEVHALITHPILSNGAEKKLIDADVRLITANTRNTVKPYGAFRVVDCGDILRTAINNIIEGKSILTTLT